MRGQKKIFVVLINGNLIFFIALLFCIGVGIWLLWQPTIWTSLPNASFVTGRKVVIDAGHGGGDPGTKSISGLLEKELNLDVALRLKRFLSRVGVYCIMTRETDRDYFGTQNLIGSKKLRDLNCRIEIANQSKADLFISIHANSFPQTIYHGAQTFYNNVNPLSKQLAETIQSQLVTCLGPNHRTAKGGDFRVLNFTKMPGVIIEIGFLSNVEEAKLLSTPKFREQIAEAIYHGIIKYFSNNRP